MPNGLLVRDFFKQERELTFTSSGSIRVSDTEHNAYRLALTIEVTDTVRQGYFSRKSLPENGHLGYFSLLKGSTVTRISSCETAKFRAFDIINQGIWNYHQSTESLQVGTGVTEGLLNTQGSWLELAIAGVPIPTCTIAKFFFADPEENLDSLLALAFLGCEEDDPLNQRRLITDYRGFPIASPFPDVVKFKGDIPCSFRFRLEAWYLINPLVYAVDSPTDSGDSTEGEDEYPTPDVSPTGDTSGFPTPNGADPESDPRDFGAGGPDAPPGTTMRVRYTRRAYNASCVESSFPDVIEVGYFGSTAVSFEYIGSVNGCDGPNTPGGLRMIIPGAASVVIAALEEQQWALATVDSVELIYP